jgi:tricorn protease
MLNLQKILICTLLTFSISFPLFASTNTLLLREPDIKGDTIVFTYGQEVWQASLTSLQAKRITSFRGQASNPKLSPDGKWIAFTGQYSGNFDVFIIPVNGGSPKQLTWHPGTDKVKGWSPDSKSIIFSSGRDSAPTNSAPRFWQVNISGNTPISLPMLRAESGSMSPDSTKFVYQKVTPWDDGWRKYRGGQNNPLRIVKLDNLQEKKLPWKGEKVTDPQWNNDGIYFLSDVNDVVNVFRFNEGKKSTQLTHHQDYDVKNYSVDKGKIVYEQHGRLFLISNNKTQQLNINISADFPWANPHWEDVSKQIESANISPTGKRAIFVARGDVFTAPAKDGDIRNISNTSARELSASWSPDGQAIAWFSDESGEYRIVISDQFGKKVNEIKLAEKGFYFDLTWSPNNKKLLYTDQKQRVWWVDIATKKKTLIDQDARVIVEKLSSPKWSADSNWIAYLKTEKTFLRNVYIYSLKSNSTHLVSDNMADNLDFTWDKDGKYLFFTASTNFASKAPWLDLSIMGKAKESYAIYAALLSSETASPIGLKQVDEEPAKEVEDKSDKETKDEDNKSTVKDILITLAGLSDRVIPIPSKPALISKLNSIEGGLLYLVHEEDRKFTLTKYTFDEQKEDTIAKNVGEYYLASNGNALLVKLKNNWKLVESEKKLAKAKPINLALNLWLDPKKEWEQKFHDAWRFQRDYFYVENIHGANWDKIYKDYLPLVEHVNHPADLTYLLDGMGAETSVGHSFTWNGQLPKVPVSQVGLLGIDVVIKDNQFVIGKIYTGEKWNNKISNNAPLTHVLDKVQVNDIIVAIDGKPFSVDQNFYQLFNGTAKKQTRLTIAKQESPTKTFDVWVKPTKSENLLRQHAWIENNRRYVEKISKGQLAYIWVPNTSTQGFEYFNRYFFAQADKKGAIIDERYNSGGSIADYFIDVLNRKLNGYFNNQMDRNTPLTSPGSLINGPKVLLINEMAGSGGDMFPYLFRFHNVGKLVGKKTWGGLVGIWGVPSFIDGGGMTAPRSGFYDLSGKWKVENEGVAPDIDVDESIISSSKGIDAQLEKAVSVAMKDLKKYKDIRQKKAPQDPVRGVN